MSASKSAVKPTPKAKVVAPKAEDDGAPYMKKLIDGRRRIAKAISAYHELVMFPSETIV